ncbi:MAG TPA: hypothetical protein EYH45_01585 [Candidatus Caldiarchaeum subterraneum]|uniref:NAD kinase n=1 Tax=Caldiarchaeum subterraneum TaxID=311458 RepID=A0A833E9A5_CALS0|nr:hypothetical protein [Candidatus Caldarchaeum subterraneum]
MQRWSGAVIVYAGRKEKAAAASQQLAGFLTKFGLDVKVMSLNEFTANSKLVDGVLLLTLGGDGTLLRAVRKITNEQVYVLGINFGRSGFLCQVDPSQMFESLEKILSGEPKVDEVMRIALYDEGKHIADALNEVLVSARVPGRVIEYSITQGDELIRDLADGVILSTPVGSTAYAMSAGGPAVDERVEAVVIVPMASMRNLRPIILNAEEPLTVEIRKGDAQAVVDGHTTYLLQSRRLVIKKAETPIRFIRAEDRPFAKRLRKRMYKH